MSLHPPLMPLRPQKSPKSYTVPSKAPRSIWMIQPYIPHSYKMLVPLIKIGDRSPLSIREIYELNNRLDSQGLVRLPEDVYNYLQMRGMQHEIQEA